MRARLDKRSWVARASGVAVALALVGVSACGMTSGGAARRGGALPAVEGVIVATIALADYGTAVAVRADGARAYVPVTSGKVLVLDLATAQVVATIATGGQPYAIALTADGARAYVMDMVTQDIVVLDTAKDRVATKISAGILARPVLAPAVAVGRDATRAYVTSATVADDHLLVVDTAANEIVHDRDLEIRPARVAVSPDGRLVYVAGCKLACIDGTLLVVEAASARIVSQVALPAAPAGLVLAPDGSRAYMPNGSAASVSVVDLATKAVTTIAVGPEPTGIAADPAGAFVYVTSFGAGSVSVVDVRTNAVVATVAVGRTPRAIAVSPDGRRAYVTHSTRTCTVLDLERATAAGGR